MSIFLRERWLDERLIFNDTLNLTRLELDFSLHGQVWVPDMYILNEKSSDFHEVTVPNRLIHVYPDGSVQLSMRYVIILPLFLLFFLLLIHPFNHASFILLLPDPRFNYRFCCRRCYNNHFNHHCIVTIMINISSNRNIINNIGFYRQFKITYWLNKKKI